MLQRQILAAPGQAVVYHVGPSLKGARDVEKIRKLYDAGTVDLVQRRVKGDDFEYIAIFRRTPAKVLDHGTFRSAGLV